MISSANRILEVGAGAGISKNFLPKLNIVRTDYLPSEDSEVTGNIDVHSLPYQDSDFDLVIVMDFLHHLSYPYSALNEMRRVCEKSKKGIIMIFVEPYVSAFSFIPYKLFHTERTSAFQRIRVNEPAVTNDPSDGNQTLPRLIFLSKLGRVEIEKIFPVDDYRISFKFLSVFSFFATGGVTRPLPTPKTIVRSLIKLEEKIPQKIMKYAGSRMIIIVERI